MTVYVFWLVIAICFLLFIWMMKKLSKKEWINISFFFNRILWFFLSTVIFSRIFFIISEWAEYNGMTNPVEFFIMSDYNFSLYWAIFGFFLVLIYSLKANKIRADKYIDVSVLSFLFVSALWYVGSFFWGQVYGRETNFGIEVLYSHPFSPVQYEVPIFPLALVYALATFILFFIFYSLSTVVNIRWLIWYLWFISFNALVLVLEGFSGKYDIVKSEFWFININQVFALFFIIISVYKLIKLLQRQPSKTEVIAN